jgi:hypothetical protein
MGYLGIKPANSPLTSELIPDGMIATSDLADLAVTPAKMSQKLTSGTAVASTSGTSIDFTGIPSWVKRITVMFSAVSTNGTSFPQVQLGDSGGVETSSYLGSTSETVSGGTSAASMSSGFLLQSGWSAASVLNGALVISLLDIATNLWVAQGCIGRSNTASTSFVGGSKSLSATLDRVRITTVNGTDTFDAGSINIMYEG